MGKTPQSKYKLKLLKPPKRPVKPYSDEDVVRWKRGELVEEERDPREEEEEESH